MRRAGIVLFQLFLGLVQQLPEGGGGGGPSPLSVLPLMAVQIAQVRGGGEGGGGGRGARGCLLLLLKRACHSGSNLLLCVWHQNVLRHACTRSWRRGAWRWAWRRAC
jgi:hypothetical protein